MKKITLFGRNSLFFILELFLYFLLLFLSWHFFDNLRLWLIFHLISFVPMLMLIRKMEEEERSGSVSKEKIKILILSVFAVIVLLSLRVSPFLSDDYHRYLWEGMVQWKGENPYLHSPEQLKFLDPKAESLVNHPKFVTVYPPAAQMIFFLSAPGGLLAYKAGIILCQLALILLLIQMARDDGLPLSLIALYAWNPTVLQETLISGHIDAWGTFFVIAFLFYLKKKKHLMMGIFLGLGVGTKLLPLLLLPLLWPYRKEWKKIGLGFIGVLFLAALPYLSAGLYLRGSLGTYAVHWRFNDFLYRGLLNLLNQNSIQAKAIAAMICGGLSLFWGFKGKDAVKGSFLIFSVFFLLSPVAHPWYLLWSLPFLSLRPSSGWILLSFSVVLSYSVQFDYIPGHPETWKEIPFFLWLEYLPPLFLLAWNCCRLKQKKFGSST